MRTKSDCWHLYVNSTSQRCKKTIKTFLIEDFSHLPPMSTTPVVHLELRISPRIGNGPNGLLRGSGKLIHEKNLKSKNSKHCPFLSILCTGEGRGQVKVCRLRKLPKMSDMTSEPKLVNLLLRSPRIDSKPGGIVPIPGLRFRKCKRLQIRTQLL